MLILGILRNNFLKKVVLCFSFKNPVKNVVLLNFQWLHIVMFCRINYESSYRQIRPEKKYISTDLPLVYFFPKGR